MVSGQQQFHRVAQHSRPAQPQEANRPPACPASSPSPSQPPTCPASPPAPPPRPPPAAAAGPAPPRASPRPDAAWPPSQFVSETPPAWLPGPRRRCGGSAGGAHQHAACRPPLWHACGTGPAAVWTTPGVSGAPCSSHTQGCASTSRQQAHAHRRQDKPTAAAQQQPQRQQRSRCPAPPAAHGRGRPPPPLPPSQPPGPAGQPPPPAARSSRATRAACCQMSGRPATGRAHKGDDQVNDPHHAAPPPPHHTAARTSRMAAAAHCLASSSICMSALSLETASLARRSSSRDWLICRAGAGRRQGRARDRAGQVGRGDPGTCMGSFDLWLLDDANAAATARDSLAGSKARRTSASIRCSSGASAEGGASSAPAAVAADAVASCSSWQQLGRGCLEGRGSGEAAARRNRRCSRRRGRCWRRHPPARAARQGEPTPGAARRRAPTNDACASCATRIVPRTGAMCDASSLWRRGTHPARVVPPPVAWNGSSITAVALSATLALCSHAEARAPCPEPPARRRCQRPGHLAHSLHCLFWVAGGTEPRPLDIFALLSCRALAYNKRKEEVL